MTYNIWYRYPNQVIRKSLNIFGSQFPHLSIEGLGLDKKHGCFCSTSYLHIKLFVLPVSEWGLVLHKHLCHVSEENIAIPQGGTGNPGHELCF
jgi:hypothetical protein